MLLFNRLSHPANIESPLINFVVVFITSSVEDGYNSLFTEIKLHKPVCGLSGEVAVVRRGKAGYKAVVVHIIGEILVLKNQPNQPTNRLVHRPNLDIQPLP